VLGSDRPQWGVPPESLNLDLIPKAGGSDPGGSFEEKRGRHERLTRGRVRIHMARVHFLDVFNLRGKGRMDVPMGPGSQGTAGRSSMKFLPTLRRQWTRPYSESIGGTIHAGTC